ncbi:zf-DHHC-domain-containing protein [Aspergillus pseudoustus]|uniref:Palmitoyltransferase n=1 Tax=Aspergillus pseudoustus TaxID=1810923 RepID=A0ABR4KA75_9EURO
MARQPDRRVNLLVSRVIPLILFGVIIYACYATTKTLCIDYLIHPTSEYTRPSRTGAGAAIIAVFYVLLLLVVITYLRLLYTVIWNPDLLPRPSLPASEQQDAHAPTRNSRGQPKKKRRRHRKSISDKPEVDVELALDNNVRPMVLPWDTAGLENFYKKDVFVCQPDGRPIYCSKCCHYKPDRTHHCREVDRCVRKMDHFCPWVGGVVSEKSFKFFIQFVFYTAVLCAFVLIVLAIFTAELRRQTGDVNPHWAIGIGLSGFFGIFTFGMTLSSLQLAAMNLTTIENLSRRSVVWTLAIRVPNHVLSRLQPGSRWAPTFRTLTYPLPPIPPPPPPMPSQPGSGEGYPPAPPPPQTDGEQHVFAILQTLPGENPFDLGSPYKNLQQVLGHSIIDWFLPVKHAPCGDHSSLESEFELGPVVARLKREAGLDSTTESNKSSPAEAHYSKHKRRRKKHHRRESGS